MFRRSSAVEQLTVNQLVVGSIPTAGAINNPFKVKPLEGFFLHKMFQKHSMNVRVYPRLSLSSPI